MEWHIKQFCDDVSVSVGTVEGESSATQTFTHYSTGTDAANWIGNIGEKFLHYREDQKLTEIYNGTGDSLTTDCHLRKQWTIYASQKKRRLLLH